MITIKLPIQNKVDISNLQRIYSSCLRFSYNRIKKENLTEKEIRNLIKSKNLFQELNSWLIQCSIREAKELYKSRKDETIIFGGKKNWYNYISGIHLFTINISKNL